WRTPIPSGVSPSSPTISGSPGAPGSARPSSIPSCAFSTTRTPKKPWPGSRLPEMALITAQALHADKARRIFDCRFDLRDPCVGARAYAEGHIPGAQYLHLHHDLSGETNGSNGRHPLPDPHNFATRLGSLG